MACAHIEGEWERPTLLADTGEVTLDPVLVITPTGTSGVFTGRFQDTGEQDFKVTCEEHGMLSKIMFTREHPDGKTTKYDAKVVRVDEKKKVILVGRFRRTTPDGLLAVTNGDWETEKPT